MVFTEKSLDEHGLKLVSHPCLSVVQWFSGSIASTFYQIQNQPNLESETQFNDEPEGDRVSRGIVRCAVGCWFVSKLLTVIIKLYAFAESKFN